MPLVLRPRYYPAGGDGVAMSARMVMAADQLLGQEKALTDAQPRTATRALVGGEGHPGR